MLKLRFPMLRPAVPVDTPLLVALADSTGIFQPHETESFQELLDDLHSGSLGEGHQAEVWADSPVDTPAGWVYFSPVAMADRVWNLWWIGVAPARQGQGIGGQLLQSVESHVQSAGGRILIIESSALPRFDSTRQFYTRRGYLECGRVPDFYADGDDKVIFVKRMAEQARVEA